VPEVLINVKTPVETTYVTRAAGLILSNQAPTIGCPAAYVYVSEVDPTVRLTIFSVREPKDSVITEFAVIAAITYSFLATLT
jgi:hypothetical protein